MHKFIPTRKSRNTHILVTQYNWPIEEYLKGNALIVYINHFDDIKNVRKHIDDTTIINGYVYIDRYASLETIDIKPELCDAPLFLYINRLGQFREVYHKLEMMKRMKVVIIFTGSENTACTDAQIVSSLGIHTGIALSSDSQLGNNVLDLITYTFYGTTPHAEIEPFSTIERYYDGESYVSPNLANFINPNRYIHVDKDQHIAFSRADLEQKKFIGDNLSVIRDAKLQDAIDEKEREWQKLFIDNHPCTFCPAFRVCSGYFASHQKEGRCREVMTELLDAIEFQKTKKNNNQSGLCQL